MIFKCETAIDFHLGYDVVTEYAKPGLIKTNYFYETGPVILKI